MLLAATSALGRLRPLDAPAQAWSNPLLPTNFTFAVYLGSRVRCCTYGIRIYSPTLQQILSPHTLSLFPYPPPHPDAMFFFRSVFLFAIALLAFVARGELWDLHLFPFR